MSRHHSDAAGDRPNLSRRSFLVAGGGLLTLALNESLKTLIGESGGELLTSAATWVHESFEHKVDDVQAGAGAQILESAVFPFNKSVSYCAGVIHPEHFDTVPFSMRLALRGPFHRAGISETTKRVGQFVGIEVPTGNIVTVGSPNSNEFAFTLFGHQTIGTTGTEYLDDAHDRPLSLPVRFLLNGPDVRNQALRIARGNYTEPNWGLIRGHQHLFPERNLSGRLHTDYLVLTKVPNVFDEHWDRTGTSIFLISGVHGPGTQGFHLLLRDQRATESLVRRLQGLKAPYWQALIPVSQIRPGTGTNEGRDVAHEIDDSHIELFPVDVERHVSRIRSHNWLADIEHVARFRTAAT
ncbi:MAG TPA: hypothetical protein VFP91_13075 [Vicinamibacterales bacterium]|nr:hypothetical protein [Vicinamibacterales bacterium]